MSASSVDIMNSEKRSIYLWGVLRNSWYGFHV